jgi:citrate lyase subunit beta/citryl-CoA lyase
VAALARSYLFAPGDNERLLGKVFDAGADAVVLDLEDAVAPERKAEARQIVSSALSVIRKASSVYVRINAVSTTYWKEDIAAAVAPSLKGIRLAKAESAEEIRALDAALTVAEKAAGIARGAVKITATIESAAGLVAALEIARVPRVESLAFGAADFIRDIGVDPDDQETQTLLARSHLVVVSRAAVINPPIASVYTRIKDPDGLRATTEAARRLGFFGRSCIHPSQVAIINEIFTPSAEQLAEARALIEAFGQTDAAATALADGRFVDKPIVERARAIVALAADLETRL